MIDGLVYPDGDRVYYQRGTGALVGWFYEPAPHGHNERSTPIGPFKTRERAEQARDEYLED